MLLFCLIFIYPVSRTAIMSLFSVKSVTSAVSTWSWAGLDNYIKLFHTPLFITSVINIGKIWLYCGIACLGLAIRSGNHPDKWSSRSEVFPCYYLYAQRYCSSRRWLYVVAVCLQWQSSGLLHSLFTALGWKSMANFQWLGTDHMSSQCASLMYSAMWATSC